MPAFAVYVTYSAVSAFAHATAFTLYLVYQVESVGLNPLQLVLAGTALEVVCFVAQVPTGVIADLYSRRLSIIIGFVLCGLGAIVPAITPTYAAVLIGTALWGIGITCVDGADQAWVADEVGSARVGRAMVRGAQSGQAASILGIAAAVGLSTWGLWLPFVVGGSVWIALGVGLAVVMPERHFQAPADLVGARMRDTLRAMRGQLDAGAWSVRRRPVLRYLFFAAFFAALASEGIDRLSQPLFLADLTFPGFGTHAFWFGLFSIGATAGSIALTGAIGRRVDALDPRRVARLVVVFQALCVVAVFGFALSREFWLAAATTLLIGLLRSSTEPLLATWLVATTEPATRATVLSFLAQVDAAGQIAGGPPVGVIGQRVSIRAALLSVGFLLAPAVALFAAALRRTEVAPANHLAEVPPGVR